MAFKYENSFAAIRRQAQQAIKDYNLKFEEHFSWLLTVSENFKNGESQGVLVPKTPAKRKMPLTAITESRESIVLDVENPPRGNSLSKRGSRKGQSKKAISKSRKAPIQEEDDEVEVLPPSKPLKRLSEETVELSSKRLRGNRSSTTTSRDSGLSSVGSRFTRTASSGVAVKEEVLTPKNTSVETSVPVNNLDENSLISSDRSPELSPIQPPLTVKASKKRSRSAGRGTFIVKEEPRVSIRSSSEPRTPNAKRPASWKDRTYVASGTNAVSSQLFESPKDASIPEQVKEPAHLPMGESVKKAVKTFEALRESHETDKARSCMAPPAISTLLKLAPPSKAPIEKTLSSTSSLDEALNAPTRVTRTKTRAMAKAAAGEEDKRSKDEHLVSEVSRVLKSPVRQMQQNQCPQKIIVKTLSKKDDDSHEKEGFTFSTSKMYKPFGSASKQPLMFFKATTPLNRLNPLTPSHSASFSGPHNLVTSIDSFISKPVVHHEVKPSREENLQKLASKAEVASKKKEEIMKAQMEEKIKKRQEKRLKVCAAREAMEKEKIELKLKMEREKEEKQRQLQAEREEKLRQEFLKKKRIAQQKAAETEERRRQEEAARLAKLKQQEEEQRRIAAQRKREQEEAERKQMERLLQEREAAAFRAKEAERLTKEAALKATKVDKVQLDQTYDKISPACKPNVAAPKQDDKQPIFKQNLDNYGIDDANTDDSSEDESKPKKAVPLWAQSKQRLPKLFEDYEVNHLQMFTFFGSQKTTPDLSKIFTAIDRRQLIRKSSAVWRTPPIKY